MRTPLLPHRPGKIRSLIGCGVAGTGKGLFKVESKCVHFYAAGEDPGDA